MVTIRLQRVGKHNRPSYRVVVADSRSRVQGRFIEIIGFYDPINKLCKLDKERIDYWKGVGAGVSDTVAGLISRDGKVELKKRTKPNRKSAVRAQQEAERKAQEEAEKKAAAEAALQAKEDEVAQASAPEEQVTETEETAENTEA